MKTAQAGWQKAGSADSIDALLSGTLSDPFAYLGPHQTPSGMVIRTFQPGAASVAILRRGTREIIEQAQLVDPAGLFEAHLDEPCSYLLRIDWPGDVQETEDSYAFGLLLGDIDLHLFAEGSHRQIGDVLGAQPVTIDQVEGVRFAVWAPNARRVSVVGDFNSWDGRRHAMRLRHSAGIWEIFIPRLKAGERYKYEVVGRDGATLPLKADPVALFAEPSPATASVVGDLHSHAWRDDRWMKHRRMHQRPDRPISIYEAHAGSWWRHENTAPHWQDLTDRLIPYVAELAFTHIELLPIMEHPFSGSWGYQPLGLFAPTARHGSIDAFKVFVDSCHQAGLGVILDWVPGHFPNDAHGLAFFDGTHLYEHQDPREGLHQDWDTLIYNYGRREVRGFLIASALHWLRHYHIDGLRVDAVASMLYRDYSRQAGHWIPNIRGGRENLEAIDFLRELNGVINHYFPDVLMIAEESTAWPHVTGHGGATALGFDHKWNMGWMNDSLRYMSRDPAHRAYHHEDMTFGLIYAFSERFVLPLSHDEVVHGKGSIIGRMPGDDWQKLANLRAYLAFMWTHPGRKLIFMGTEFGQWQEWNHDHALDWHLLDEPAHQQLQMLVRELNRLYRARPTLHHADDRSDSFRWVIGNDMQQSIFVYLRQSHEPHHRPLLIICNFTPVPRSDYRVGVPVAGSWQEVLNSDSGFFGGSNLGNGGAVHSEAIASHGYRQSLQLVLPPLATLILEPNN